MNKEKLMCVLRGYMNLNYEERAMFEQEVSNAMRSNNHRDILLRKIETFSQNLGPTNNVNCGCCGKG